MGKRSVLWRPGVLTLPEAEVVLPESLAIVYERARDQFETARDEFVQADEAVARYVKSVLRREPGHPGVRDA